MYSMVVAGKVNEVISPVRHRVPNLVTVTVAPPPVAQAPFTVGHSVALAGVQPGASAVPLATPPPGRCGVIGAPVVPGTVTGCWPAPGVEPGPPTPVPGPEPVPP